MGEIFMPKMGDAMTEGRVVRWYKQEGDEVTKGEAVLEIETDKVNLDLEAEESGTLTRIAVEEGAMADVGTTLAVIGDEEPAAEKKPAREEKPPKKEKPAKEEKPAEKKAGKKDQPELPEPDAEEAKTPAEAEETAAAPPQSDRKPAEQLEKIAEGAHVRSSPLARKVASELGVELSSVRGSGPGGRVVADDVRKAAEGGAETRKAPDKAPAEKIPAGTLETKDVPLSAMRRTIALRLTESLGPIPHFFLTIETDVTRLLEMRAQLNEMQSVKTSPNDFVIRAVALSLLEHPSVNASFSADAIKLHGNVDIGVAVATPEGLLTPVVRTADKLSIPDIAGRIRDLAERARNRKLKPDEYQGATFTISNLGMYGIDEFTAIINPPNAAILAVGAAVRKPVVEEEQVVIRDRMRITMSCDHRVIDGAMGAEFLQTLRRNLEQPLRLLVTPGGNE